MVPGTIPRTNQLDAHMTMRVGNGSVAPSPANIAAKVGMTFQRMMVMTMPAIDTTAIGYIIAPLICCCSLTDFSM